MSAMTLEGHELTVTGLVLDPAGEGTLVSGSRDSTVRVWDIETEAQVRSAEISRNLVTCMAWVPGERVVVQGSEDLSVRLWDVRETSLKAAQTLAGYVYFPLCVDVSGDGRYFLTGSKGFDGVGCELRIWDRRMGKVRVCVCACVWVCCVSLGGGVDLGVRECIQGWMDRLME